MKQLILPLCLLFFVCEGAEARSARAKKSRPSRNAASATGISGELQKFSGLRLKGRLKKPDVAYIYKRKGLKADQIVNIPEDFNEEIVQGAGQF